MRPERRIFEDAIERTPEERDAYLDDACGPDLNLRRRVNRLLEAHEDVGSFLSEPTDGAGIDLTSASEQTGTNGFGEIEAPEERPGARIGPYRILERIGEGGFGSVFVAQQDEPIRRRVAIKIVKLGMDTRQVIRRFEQERQALALMEHPNIARVLDAGATDSGRPYFVMELVRGEPVTAYADRRGLSIEERLRLFIPMCHAVQHAHQKGIIHRDIKPSNVLITERDASPAPKIIDFGIAKATNAELADRTVYTGVRQIVGTPQYMAPEQATLSELDIDTRCDVYALGALLYELVTGHTPFDARRLRRAGYAELHRIITEEEPARPSMRVTSMDAATQDAHARKRCLEAGALARLLRGDLDAIVMKALEKDRSRRYSTAVALADDIDRFLRCEPVVASPPTARYRLSRFVRRNRGAVIATGLAGAVLLLSTIGLAWGLVEAHRERDRAIVAGTRESAARLQADEARFDAENALDAAEERAHAAALAAADASLARHDLGFARTLLLETSPGRRGWAWHHLAGRLDGAESTIYGHTWGIFAGALDPTGTRVASISVEDGIHVHDWSTGRELLHIKGVYANPGECIAFAPDGRTIATIVDYRFVGLFDTATGAEVRRFDVELEPFRQSVVRWSDDGARILVCDGTARLLDAETGDELRAFAVEEDRIANVDFAPDGGRIAAVHMSGFVRMFDADTGDVLWEIEPAQTGSASGIGFSPDGAHIAIAGTDTRVRVRRTEDGALHATATGHDRPVTYVAWHPDSSRFATGSLDGTARVWALDGSELQVLAGHTDAVTTARFSADGSRVITASLDRTLRVWAIESSQVERPPSTVSRWLALRPDGTLGLRVDHDPFTFAPSTLLLVDPRTTVVRSTLPSADAPFVSTAAFDRGGGLLALGLHDGTVVVVDTANGAERARLTDPGPGIAAIAFPVGRGAVVAAGASGVTWWDIGSWRSIRQWVGPAPITALASTPDGVILAAGDAGGAVHFIESETGTLLRSVKCSAFAIADVICLPERDRIVTASLDPDAGGIPVAVGGLEINVHRFSDGSAVRSTRFDTLALGDAPVALSFSPLGNGTVTVGPVAPGRVPLIDLESGRRVLSLDTRFWLGVTRAVFTGRDGHDLLAFGFYGHAEQWNATAGFDVARVDAAAPAAARLVERLVREEYFLEHVLPAVDDVNGLDAATRAAARRLALDQVPPLAHYLRQLRRRVVEDTVLDSDPALGRAMLTYHESGPVLSTVGAMRFRLGDDAAHDLLERAAAETVPYDFDAVALAFLGLARLEAGDVDGARSALERAEAASATGDQQHRRNSAAVMGELRAHLLDR